MGIFRRYILSRKHLEIDLRALSASSTVEDDGQNKENDASGDGCDYRRRDCSHISQIKSPKIIDTMP